MAALQALLHCLDAFAKPGGALERLLPGATYVLEPPAAASAGAFCGLRLLPGAELSAALQQLHMNLGRVALREPPKYDLRLAVGAWDEGDKVRCEVQGVGTSCRARRIALAHLHRFRSFV